MVVGESQDKYLLELALKLTNKNRLLKQIPNLLSLELETGLTHFI